MSTDAEHLAWLNEISERIRNLRELPLEERGKASAALRGELQHFLSGLVRDAEAAEDEVRPAFLTERIAALRPARLRAAAEASRADLDRRLRIAVYEWRDRRREVEFRALNAKRTDPPEEAPPPLAWTEIVQGFAATKEPGATEVRAEIERVWAHLEARTREAGTSHSLPSRDDPRVFLPFGQFRLEFHRVELAYLWVRVFAEWIEDARPAPAGLYRLPLAAVDVHRGLAAKRHGSAHGLAVEASPIAHGQITRLALELPRGAQLEIGATGRLVTVPADFEDDGTLKPEAVLRLIRQVTGPQTALIGHAAFAMAEEDAAEEGRPFDGRFWFWRSRLADLLGYSRKPNAKASRDRIRSEVTRALGDRFAVYAGAHLAQVWKRPDGKTTTIRGTLLYPTQKEEVTTRARGKVGRDKKMEWRIRDELAALARTHYILVPRDLLSHGKDDPREHACAVRLYEVIACDWTRNALKVAAGSSRALSWDRLLSETHLVPASRGSRTVAEDALRRYLDLLGRRDVINWREATLDDGRPGVIVTPAREELRTRLEGLAQRRRALSPRLHGA